MTEFYLLGSVIVFIYLSVVMYKEMPHEGFNKLHDIIGCHYLYLYCHVFPG